MENGKKYGMPLWVVVGLVIALFTMFFSFHNRLVNIEEDVKLAEANVETAMQRRLELIPDLIETVKAYSKHEEKIFSDITEAREALAMAMETGSPEEVSEANNKLSAQVNQLLAIAEAYPELTSGKEYISLMDQLEGSVNRIAVARADYNQMVTEYNKKIRKLPDSFFANLFGFHEMEQFKADPEAQKTNMVSFD